MSFDTYANFVIEFTSWVDNDDAAAKATSFIELAQSHLNRELKLEDMVVLAEAETAAGDAWLPKPTGFQGMRRLKLGTGDQTEGLDYVTPAEMDDYSSNNIGGRPRVFTLLGNRIRLGPIPDAAYYVEMAYYRAVTPISTTVASNIFLEQAPKLLLAATLAEAYEWLRDESERAYWAGKRDALIQEHNTDADEGRFPDGQLAMWSA